MNRMALAACFVAASAAAQIPGFTSTPIDFPGIASQEAVDSSGNVWIVDPTNHVLGKIELPSRLYTSYPLPASEENPGLYNIATTPDGAVWYGDYNNPTIGRRSPDGTFTQYTVPAPTYHIAGSHDNGVFFSFFYSSPIQALGYLNPAEGVAYKPLAFPAGAFVENLTVGPDGAAYFTDLRSNHRIVRIGLDGSVTKFADTVPNPPSSFAWYPSITTGPDGNMWFSHGAAIARLRLSDGAVTEFPVPYANADPSGICAGGDGNIWFADSFAGAGVVSQLVVFTATDDGHATINASPGIGEPIGILLVAPKPATTLSASSIRLADTSTGCPDVEFVVEQNRQSGANLDLVTAPPLFPKCADLEVSITGFNIAPDHGTLQFSLQISNAGPDDAAVPTLVVGPYLAASALYVNNFPNWHCSTLAGTITLCNRTSDMPAGQIDLGQFGVVLAIPVAHVSGIIGVSGFASSSTPDPTPDNEFSADINPPEKHPKSIKPVPPPTAPPIKRPPHA